MAWMVITVIPWTLAVLLVSLWLTHRRLVDGGQLVSVW